MDEPTQPKSAPRLGLKRESSRNLLSTRTLSGKIDRPEHQPQEPVKPERHPNLFVIPHKAYRVMFCDVYQKIGNVDYTNDEDVAELQKLVNQAVWIYSAHNHEESDYFAEQIKAKDPVTVAKWNEDHDEHSIQLRSFDGTIAAVVQEKDHAKREQLLDEMYLTFGEFLAADLAHMAWEERVVMQVFWDNFTFDEIAAIEGEFMRTRLDPAVLQATVPFVIRGHNISGRIGILKMLQASGAPEHDIRAVLGLVEVYATKTELAAIKKAVGLE